MPYWLCRPKAGLPEITLRFAFPYGNRHGTLREADTTDEALAKLGPWWQTYVAEGWAEIVAYAEDP